MLVSDLLTKVRLRIRDKDSVEYTDNELLGYVNDAILLIGYELIAMQDAEMIVDLSLESASTLKPANFLRFTGALPVMVQGNNLVVYGKLPCITRYFKKPTLVSTIDETLPFTNEGYNQIMTQIVSMIALNRNEFDVSQDKALIDEVRKLISTAS